MSGRKSWADQQGIPTGVIGEIVNNVTIAEKNRATVYEDRKAEIEVLRSLAHNSYRRKGVEAVLFGIEAEGQFTKYAIFVQDGFLVEVGCDEL